MEMVEKKIGKAARPQRKVGLIGLFGHTFAIDETGDKSVQFQFEIIRRLPPDRWVVQHFSFMDGRPTNVTVYPKAFCWGKT
jgi:hypothetical protein